LQCFFVARGFSAREASVFSGKVVEMFRRTAAVLGLAVSLLGASFTLADAPATQPAKALRVAVYTDAGAGDTGWTNVTNCLSKLPDGFSYYQVTAEDIRAGKLAGADVLVQPGGSGSKQAKTLEDSGLQIIRDFVKSGHGYVGICAGAYLSTNDYPWSLNFINAKVLDKKHWARGPETKIKIHFTPEGQQILGQDADVKEVIYHQGPILAPSTQPDMPAYTPLAIYDTEIVSPKGGIPGVMVGATAIAAGTYGQGHVIAISPHPERSPGLDGVIRRAVQWAAEPAK
jgi:hypothetical protein